MKRTGCKWLLEMHLETILAPGRAGAMTEYAPSIWSSPHPTGSATDLQCHFDETHLPGTVPRQTINKWETTWLGNQAESGHVIKAEILGTYIWEKGALKP